jgi:hypothetical protein
MAIDRTETTAGAPPPGGGLTAQEELSWSREEWRPSGRQGKKVATTLLRRSGRGEAGLRPDQAIEEAVWSGLDTGSRRRHWRQATAKAGRTGPHRRSASPLPGLAHSPTRTMPPAAPPLTGSMTARRYGLARPALWTGQEKGVTSIRRNAPDTAPQPVETGRQGFLALVAPPACPAFSRGPDSRPHRRGPPCLRPAERL